MKIDSVKITCYGTELVYDRQCAIKEFTEAYWNSEGSEQQRYAYILECLRLGDKVINDEDRY